METDKIDAALKAAIAEREKRTQEKVDAELLVRVPLTVTSSTVGGAALRIEQAQAQKTDEIRGTGETRPIHFDVRLVISGVSRPWDNPQHSASSVSAELAADGVLPQRRRR